MCGRFSLTADGETLAAFFELPALTAPLEPRFNIAPTQSVAIIRLSQGGARRLDLVRWGLVPHWSRDRRVSARLINARAESVHEKPAFREAMKRRRCLVAADGFYEWKRTGSTKQPFLVRLRDGAPFAMAGLWERWRDEHDQVLDSCTIITTRANALVAPIHDRMPVILPPETWDAWLARNTAELAPLRALLVPPPAEILEALPLGAQAPGESASAGAAPPESRPPGPLRGK